MSGDPKVREWNEEDARFAREVILHVGNTLIDNLGVKDFTHEVVRNNSVSVVEVKRVLAWIVDQSDGFKKAVVVDFHKGKAALVGLCLCKINNDLRRVISGLEAGATPLPYVSSGWTSGELFPWVMISDLTQTEGTPATDNKAVQTFVVYDNQQSQSTPVMLASITADHTH